MIEGHSLAYSDVYLKPRYSELRSRADADLSVEFLGRKFKTPWIPSNMESVIDAKTARWLSENGYFYIFHRFGKTHDHPQNFVRDMNRRGAVAKLISISVGVGEEAKRLIDSICWEQHIVDYITIDVAHGHHILVKEMIEYIKKAPFKSYLGLYGAHGRGLTSVPLTYRPKIIAGNVCTPEAVRDLASWGADAVKVGLSMGAACTTYDATGVGSPMFSAVWNCSGQGVPIIADGGVRSHGDISKAIYAGASLVMVGSLVAACRDSAAKTVIKHRKTGFCDATGHDEVEAVEYKEYYGSASQYCSSRNAYIEGRKLLIECNRLTVEQWYQKTAESVGSAISYAGGKSLEDLREFTHNVR